MPKPKSLSTTSLPDPAKKAFKALTVKQRKLVLAYIENDFHGAKACLEAGYSKASAKRQTPLRGKNVRRAIDALLEELGASSERITSDLAEIAFGADLADFVPLVNGSMDLEEARASGVSTRLIKKLKVRREAAKEGEAPTELVELELYDRITALDKLAKIRHMYERSDSGQQSVIPDMADDVPMADRIRVTIEALRLPVAK